MKQENFRFLWPFAGLAFAALFSLAVMALWNWVLPAVTGLPEINFLQAAGLLALSRILFGGFGGFGAAGGMFAGMRGADRGHINPFREKWFKMSDEERREFIRKHNPCRAPFFKEHDLDEPDPDKDKE
jgi:hypothetical protein